MRRYFLKRIILVVPTWLGITVVVFALVQLTPGGPVEQRLAEWQWTAQAHGAFVSLTTAQRDSLVAYYGFDKPLWRRYGHWLARIARGDLGTSYEYGRPVSELLAQAMPVSACFGLFSLAFCYCLCVPLGILKALREGSSWDFVTSGALMLLGAIPPFVLALGLIHTFASGTLWRILPMEGWRSDDLLALGMWARVADVSRHLVLPLAAYTLGLLGSLTFLVKDSLLDVTHSTYVTAARARGLSERSLLIRHALAHAWLRLASSLSQNIAYFFTGSILIESIFSLRGIGRLSFEASLARDYPVLLATVLVIGTLHIAGNLLCDLLYAAIDPRLRLDAV